MWLFLVLYFYSLLPKFVSLSEDFIEKSHETLWENLDLDT